MTERIACERPGPNSSPYYGRETSTPKTHASRPKNMMLAYHARRAEPAQPPFVSHAKTRRRRPGAQNSSSRSTLFNGAVFSPWTRQLLRRIQSNATRASVFAPVFKARKRDLTMWTPRHLSAGDLNAGPPGRKQAKRRTKGRQRQ